MLALVGKNSAIHPNHNRRKMDADVDQRRNSKKNSSRKRAKMGRKNMTTRPTRKTTRKYASNLLEENNMCEKCVNRNNRSVWNCWGCGNEAIPYAITDTHELEKTFNAEWERRINR